ncbi:MAG: MiaB/RimO family radical SAM methylthiotransferase, partial [Actinomycetota bacterium]|nr:MiaB/RimO family radical SAM methylthiotransferase [Actinomycetota bacterium]
RRALRDPGAPPVVVTGCMAAIDPDALTALGSRVIVVADKARVVTRIVEILAGMSSATVGSPRSGDVSHPGNPVSVARRTRALLKIEDGCDAFCAYCIVPYTRGAPRSIPLDEVVSSAHELVAHGAPEIVLTGINIGRYRDGESDLCEVVAAVAGTGVGRLRLSSIEPLDITPRLLSVLADTAAFCRHLHVPLQSGSDRVLASMGRAYDTEAYRRRIEMARAALPGLAVTADVICGFPTEQSEDAEATAAFVRDLELTGLHVFRYSARSGTKAAVMDGQVHPGEIARRADRLRRVGDELKGHFLSSLVGSSRSVLMESKRADGRWEGSTPDYARVVVEGCAEIESGHVARVLLTDMGNGVLLGREE